MPEMRASLGAPQGDSAQALSESALPLSEMEFNMMNTREFFKTCGTAALSLAISKPVNQDVRQKHYITSCKWDELIGVRLEWPNRFGQKKNPTPGHDWVIVECLPSPCYINGTWLDNPRRDLYAAVPCGIRHERELFFFDPVTTEDGFDYSMVDLTTPSGFRWYVEL